MADLEPRRSVRATKGQHKAHEQMDQAPEPPKQRKKRQSKKADEAEEEYIRCVCGESYDDPWIQCEKCQAWQHCVCMGMSIFQEDIKAITYSCEKCSPESHPEHQELLEAMARGENLWEERRRRHAEEQGGKKKRGRKAKPKPGDESKDDGPPSSGKTQGSATPEPKAGASSKRRVTEDQEKEPKAGHKLRKVSESQAVPSASHDHVFPGDLNERFSSLPETRLGPAKALFRSIFHTLVAIDKKGGVIPDDDVPLDARATDLTLAVEQAVFDAHTNAKKYAAQVHTLQFNLKNNHELLARLFKKRLTPTTLASMTTDELASSELQKETAEMIARAEKQSILITEDRPRWRRTHKGDEVVEVENFAVPSDEMSSARRRLSVRDAKGEATRPQAAGEAAGEQVELPASHDRPTASGMYIDTQAAQYSPKQDFDIKKVFNTVKSPTQAHKRRPSVAIPVGASNGPGVDPEVDRLLQDDGNESPPYSPTEETDPSVVWRGRLVMTSVGDFSAYAKHVGGADLRATIGLPWEQLLPSRLAVAGRIDQQQAITYLCGLRYSPGADVVVASISPSSQSSMAEFNAILNYFESKKRYGVVGDKRFANVRDTYLVPLPAGTGNLPEFMLNLSDNFIPQSRAEPMMLVVIVYRTDQHAASATNGQPAEISTAGAGPSFAAQQKANPAAAPAFSPTSPMGSFPSHQGPAARQAGAGLPHHPPQSPSQAQAAEVERERLQKAGEALAREVLGPFSTSPTLNFLLPQAYQMTRVEWSVVRNLYEQDPKTRDDLAYLSQCLASLPPANASSPSLPESLPRNMPAPVTGTFS